MAEVETRQSVQDILKDMRGLDGLKRLFWQELNYERENKPLSTRQWPESAKNALADDPILFASGGEDKAFHVVYCRLTSAELKRGCQRPIVDYLLRDHPYALFVFSNKAQTAWTRFARQRPGDKSMHDTSASEASRCLRTGHADEKPDAT